MPPDHSPLTLDSQKLWCGEIKAEGSCSLEAAKPEDSKPKSEFVSSDHQSKMFYCSVAQLCLTLCHQLPEFKCMSIESVMPSNHLILCHPLLLLPSIYPSIRVFPSKLALCIRWPKYWSFSFSISPSNEYSGLISFQIDWFDLLAVQRTLKSLLQHHSLKVSILQHSAFQWSNSQIHTRQTDFELKKKKKSSGFESTEVGAQIIPTLSFIFICERLSLAFKVPQ